MLLGEVIVKKYTYVIKSQTSQLVTIVVKHNDRNKAREDIQDALDNYGVVFTEQLFSGQSFSSTIFTIGNLKYKIMFKPAKSGGSGGGADNTKLTESAQAVYCAVAQECINRRLKCASDVHTNYKKYMANYDIDGDINKIINDLPEEWEVSSVLSANEIMKFLPTGTKYIFHRGSATVEKIEKKFNQVKQNRKELTEVANLNINKWTPADIYAIKTGFVLDIDKITTLKQLTDYMVEQYQNKNVFGISLKKAVEKASITYMNTPGQKKPPKAKFKDVAVQAAGSTKDIFSSKDVYLSIDYDSHLYKVQLRTFDNTGKVSQWQGEVKGENANYGKIGGGVIVSFLQSALGYKMTDMNTVANELKVKNINRLEKMYDLYSSSTQTSVRMKKEDFLNSAKQQNFDKLLSKYFGLEVAATVIKSPKRDDFYDQIIKYAKSNTSLSAPFVIIS